MFLRLHTQYRSFIEYILPNSTRRREFYRIFVRVFRVLLSEGPIGLWRHAQSYWRNWINRQVRRDPILIYQMGKVGSLSLLEATKNAYQDLSLDTPIYHCHSLMDFEKYEIFIKTKMGNSKAEFNGLERDKKLRSEIDSHPDQLWNLISLVRDPVARNIAAFFQNIDYYVPGWKEQWENKTLSISKLLEYFFANDEINAPVWFETKLEPIFGIDVYSTPFPQKVGYKIYQNPPRANLLLIRLEDLNHAGVGAVKKYLKLPSFTLQRTNVGHEKSYADIYNVFRQTPMPKFYVERMYSTRLAKHFYTKDELAAFAYKWTRKIS